MIRWTTLGFLLLLATVIVAQQQQNHTVTESGSVVHAYYAPFFLEIGTNDGGRGGEHIQGYVYRVVGASSSEHSISLLCSGAQEKEQLTWLPVDENPLVPLYMKIAGAWDPSVLSPVIGMDKGFYGYKVTNQSDFLGHACHVVIGYGQHQFRTVPRKEVLIPQECNSEELYKNIMRQRAYISRVDATNKDKDEDEFLSESVLRTRISVVQALLYQNAYEACRRHVETSYVELGPVDQLEEDSMTCYERKGSDAWTIDPCCNRALQMEQCCAPRTLWTRTMGLRQMLKPSIEKECAETRKVERALEAYTRARRQERACFQQTAQLGATFEDAALMRRVLVTCYEKLYGASCSLHSDCYTHCQRRAREQEEGYCMPPLPDEEEGILHQCLMEHGSVLFLRYFRQQQQQTLAFSTEQCSGPTGYMHSSRYVLEKRADCSGRDGDCVCVTPTDDVPEALRAYFVRSPWQAPLYRHALESLSENHSSSSSLGCYEAVWKQGSREACLMDLRCNWDASKSVQECTSWSLSSHFCSSLDGAALTQEPQCYARVRNARECTRQGGTVGPSGMWECLFGDLKEEDQCLPQGLCPQRSALRESLKHALGPRHCPSSCTMTAGSQYEDMCQQVGGWYNNHIGRCQLPLDSIHCQELSAEYDLEWFPGRTYIPGVMHTKEICEAGLCSIDSHLSPTECRSVSMCTKPCAKCVPKQAGRTLCYADNVTETECHHMGGIYNDPQEGACLLPLLTSEDECMDGNWTRFFHSCDDYALEDCKRMPNLPSGRARRHLRCRIDSDSMCETRAECEQAGTCSDSELGTRRKRGSCVFPYDGTASMCSKDRVYTYMGCLDRRIKKKKECTNLGGQWVRKAVTRQECEAQGTMCTTPGGPFLEPTHKSADMCLRCDAEARVIPRYRWSAGEWQTGEVTPTVWKARAFAPVNVWTHTLNWTRVASLVEHVSMQVISKELKSALMCTHNRESLPLQQIACACERRHSGGSCFDAGEQVELAEQNLMSGVETVGGWAHASWRVHSHADLEDGTILSADVLSTTSLLTEEEEKDRKGIQKRGVSLRSPYNPNQYEVVLNHVDYVVGQLISDGVTLILPANVTARLCINVDQSIPRDPDMIYPVVDFAGYNASQPKWWPLSLDDIEVVGNFSQVCANITSDTYEGDTYFVILRAAEPWQFITGGLLPTTTATTTAAATTVTTLVVPTNATTTILSTTVPATLVTVESDVSPAIIIVIIMSSLLGMALIAVLVACCVHSNTKRKVVSVGSRIQPPPIRKGPKSGVGGGGPNQRVPHSGTQRRRTRFSIQQ